jgi:hypothetical protein
MSGNSRRIVYAGANHHLMTQGASAKLRVTLILRSDAQHRVSKDGPETCACRPILLDRPSRRPPRGLLRTRGEFR